MEYTISFDPAGTTMEVDAGGVQIVRGPAGAPGITPQIGENGNWWVGTVDTGVPASSGVALRDHMSNETAHPHLIIDGNR